MRDVLAEREAGPDERALERHLLAHADPASIELCAVAARGREQLLPHRIVDDAVLETAAVLDRDRDREDREPVQEVGRAVEGIDDPDELVAAAASALLAEKTMVGMRPADGLDDL